MEPINRRSYFRIDDQLGINYQILDEQEYQQHQQEHRIARLEDHQQRVLEQKLSSAIRSVEIRYPDIGEILSLLNQKIEQLDHATDKHTKLEGGDEAPRAVNISASGVSFFQETPLGRDTSLELLLTLHPNNRQLRLFGKVIDCFTQKTSDTEHYKISVKFDFLVEEDREELVQYIMHQQNIALRQNSGIDDIAD